MIVKWMKVKQTKSYHCERIIQKVVLDTGTLPRLYFKSNNLLKSFILLYISFWENDGIVTNNNN